jgi:voltage-dependent potassium channel beta subunit
MLYRKLGRSGLQVSEIALGSWLTLGSHVGRNASREIVHQAFDLGINLFDTADVYADGRAETALGEALRGIPRSYSVIATKCFFPASEQPNDRGLSRKHIFESVERSLTRLGTDYIDLMQCHRFDPDTPVDETLRAFEDLIRQGKVLYWGVSDWSAAEIADVCDRADRCGAPRPIANQPQYSILRRGIEAGVLASCQRQGLGLLAFSPLAQGALTGKYRGGHRPAGSRASDDRRNTSMSAFLESHTLSRVDALAPLAEALDISLAQLALAWCLRQPAVSSVIVGVSGRAQLEENAAASSLQLPDDTLARIDEIAPPPEIESES